MYSYTDGWDFHVASNSGSTPGMGHASTGRDGTAFSCSANCRTGPTGLPLAPALWMEVSRRAKHAEASGVRAAVATARAKSTETPGSMTRRPRVRHTSSGATASRRTQAVKYTVRAWKEGSVEASGALHAAAAAATSRLNGGERGRGGGRGAGAKKSTTGRGSRRVQTEEREVQAYARKTGTMGLRNAL